MKVRFVNSTISSWHGVKAYMSGYDGTTDVTLQWFRTFAGSISERNWSSSSTSDGLGKPYGAHMFDYLGRVQKGGSAEPFSTTKNAWTQRPALKDTFDIYSCAYMRYAMQRDNCFRG